MPTSISRRIFLQGLLGLGVFVAGGCGDSLPPLELGALSVKNLRQIVTKDSRNSRRLMWEADSPLADVAVEYRLPGSTAAAKVLADSEAFTDDGVTAQQYAATLTGLDSGKSYEYRLLSGDRATSWHDLRTDDGGNFTALIFPDSQSSDYSGWEKLARAAYERTPEAALFVNMGDIVDNGEDNSQWRAWLAAVEAFSDKIPFAPVMGNHETYDRQWQVRLPVAYLKYFDVPENGSADFGRYYYSFDYGQVHFVVLNTEWEETDPFVAGLMEEQLDWLRRDAKASRKPWRIALLHRDVLQYGIHGRPERRPGFSDVGLSFMPLFDELDFDLVFTAHLHTYRNRGHLRHFVRNADGPLYILTGVAGDVRYPGLWIDHELDEVIAPQPETDNYLTLTVSDRDLVVRCYLPDGTRIDEAVVSH